MKKLRYGIISASSIVGRFVNAVRETDHSEVVAIATRSKPDSTFGIETVYDNYQDLVDNPNVDIVYIANINDQHVTEIKRALNANKHVLCEKPFVLYPQEVLDCFALAKEKNLFLMEAQKAPFLPVTQHLKRIIDTNELGTCYKATFNNCFGGRHPEGHWMHQAHQGGVWIPSANYILETCQFLFGSKPLEYQAMLSTYGPENTIDESIISLRYPQDILVQGSITTRVITDDMTKVYFDKGWVEIYQNWKARKLVIHRLDEEPEEIHYPVEHELVYEVNHVHEMISQGRITSDVMTPEVTYDCCHLVHEVYLQSQGQ